jgi:hypothetical protein
MILEALVNQIAQRFQHEKRAQVCLWFDPEQEFLRLLPAVERHLEAQIPAPFRLLAYDPEQLRGQIWLKYQVHQTLAELPEAERRACRFLVYLPLSEDRLDGPDERGEHHLELLTEYRHAGVIWRLGGKRPTLFRFLRAADVPLPADPKAQRQLYEGGVDSLLAKYAARFAEHSASHWQVPLTPELARTAVLGDLDQRLIDIAAAPELVWQEIKDQGLLPELTAAVRARYGFPDRAGVVGHWVADRDRPEQWPARAWIEALAGTLALTETYLAYGSPADFPFSDRLPPPTLRNHHSALLQRWLRDAEGRAAWDRLIAQAEKDLDLSSWAADREGQAFAFPHLVRLRWQRTLDALEAAADKASSTGAFFTEHRHAIRREAEFSRASDSPVGAWSLLLRLADLLDACKAGQMEVGQQGQSTGVRDMVALYVANAGRIEQAHMAVRREADELGLPVVGAIADRHYADYALALNGRFFEGFAQQSTAQIDGLPDAGEQLAQQLWHAKGRRAVIIIDALRYDCALALGNALPGLNVQVEPMRAELPTVTAMGMTALLPLGNAKLSLSTAGGQVRPQVDGQDCSARSQRLALLKAFGADCRDIDDVEGLAKAEGLGELLVVFGHDEIDDIGHGQGNTLIRHLHLEVQRLARLVRKLHRFGYPNVHVVTDHGFVLLDENRLPEQVPCDKDWCHVLKERYAVVPAHADLPLTSFPTRWDAEVRIAVPPGLSFFKLEKSFSHGGAALQELVIPHLRSKAAAPQEKRIGVEVVLPTFELMRTAVKVILRPTLDTGGQSGQMSLFTPKGRTLELDVWRLSAAGVSVLATPAPKQVQLDAAQVEQPVNLFFHSAQSFAKGELLELDIRDLDTGEQFPPGGIKLTVGRDM